MTDGSLQVPGLGQSGLQGIALKPEKFVLKVIVLLAYSEPHIDIYSPIVVSAELLVQYAQC